MRLDNVFEGKPRDSLDLALVDVRENYPTLPIAPFKVKIHRINLPLLCTRPLLVYKMFQKFFDLDDVHTAVPVTPSKGLGLAIPRTSVVRYFVTFLAHGVIYHVSCPGCSRAAVCVCVCVFSGRTSY